MQNFKLEEMKTEVRKLIKPYLEELIRIHAGNIISVNLYGSATGRDFSPKISDVNLLVIFDKLEMEDLKKSLKLVSSGINKKIAAPLFLSLRHMQTSQDVFPIEFLEMQENHLCLYGEDILKDMNITKDNIRLFCEEQIKGKLIRLRQAYLEVGLRKKGIEALMKESLFSLMPVFRNLLRIKGTPPPVDKESVLKRMAQEFGLEGDVFIAILRDKKNDEKISGQDVEVYFGRYIEEIKKLAVAVDKL